jgi:hypothetical protein
LLILFIFLKTIKWEHGGSQNVSHLALMYIQPRNTSQTLASLKCSHPFFPSLSLSHVSFFLSLLWSLKNKLSF